MQIINKYQIFIALAEQSFPSGQGSQVVGTRVAVAVNQKTIVSQLEARYLVEKSWFSTLSAIDQQRIVLLDQFHHQSQQLGVGSSGHPDLIERNALFVNLEILFQRIPEDPLVVFS